MSSNSDKTLLLKRLALLITGLFLSSLGVALLKKAALGVSPISSAANIASIAVPNLSLGTWLIIWNCVLILAQFLILRRDFRPLELLQIPLSVLCGEILEVREGTLVAALLTGVFVNIFSGLFIRLKSREKTGVA